MMIGSKSLISSISRARIPVYFVNRFMGSSSSTTTPNIKVGFEEGIRGVVPDDEDQSTGRERWEYEQMKNGNVDMYHDKAIHVKRSISEGDLGMFN